jgi:hypothetical protein
MELSLVQAATPAGAAILAMILIQLFKANLPIEWVPRVAVLLGIAITVLASAATGALSNEILGQAIINGILGGASAVGLYELVKGPLNLTSRSDMS